jgi:hypothetical protein
MSHRKLINGGSAWELQAPIDLIIHTKAPGKWKIVDMETGQEYIGSAEPNKYGCWIRIKDIDGKD